MALVWVVEIADQPPTVYPGWEDFITDVRHSHPKLRLGTLNIFMTDRTARGLLKRIGDTLGLIEGGEIVGKVSVRELKE